jgi:hypothetical protein
LPWLLDINLLVGYLPASVGRSDTAIQFETNGVPNEGDCNAQS